MITAPVPGRAAPPIVVDGVTLNVAAVAALARNCTPAATLSAEAAARMQLSRATRIRAVDSGQPVYGVTTGFGDNADIQIRAGDAPGLQHNLIAYHLAGTGGPVGDDVVRATLLIRANTLAAGWSGVRPNVAQRLLDLLAHDALPVIPTRGSVGASGDLIPLSYAAAAVCGTGELRFAGRTRPTAEVLTDIGLAPLTLEPKEGLALINGTSFSAALAVLALDSAQRLVTAAEIGTALTVEAIQGTRDPFAPFLHAAKPHPGQIASAAAINELLTGSDHAQDRRHHTTALHPGEHAARRQRRLDRTVQDRYSIRCAPQVIGVLRDTLAWAQRWIDTEINAATDNPLFPDAGDTAHYGGNFYGGHVAAAMDALKVATSNVADLLDRQVALLVDDRYNHTLPKNLVAPGSGEPELQHGFKAMQIAASAITAEALSRSSPSSTFSRSTECHNQDKVSLSSTAAVSAREVVELATEVAAIQLLTACQAVDLRGRQRCGSATGAAHDAIRNVSAFVERDRRLDHDIAKVKNLLLSYLS